MLFLWEGDIVPKKLIIDSCIDCCNFDYQYYTYNEKCKLLKRAIDRDKNNDFAIPEDCPLENA